jgi:hypothetical protein
MVKEEKDEQLDERLNQEQIEIEFKNSKKPPRRLSTRP